MKPAIKVAGKTYLGKNHAQAIKKAQRDGHEIKIADKESLGRFKVGSKLLTRKQTKKKYGISHSHEIRQK